MIKFYLTKIEKEEINDNTGAIWTVEDVPKLWRLKVEEALKEAMHE